MQRRFLKDDLKIPLIILRIRESERTEDPVLRQVFYFDPLE